MKYSILFLSLFHFVSPDMGTWRHDPKRPVTSQTVPRNPNLYGEVTIAATGSFVDGNGQNIGRSPIVFHELQENFNRSTGKRGDPESHISSINLATVAFKQSDSRYTPKPGVAGYKK